MTIDERLERLAERHEALSHAVELLAQMHRDNEAETAVMRRENEKRMAQMMDAINRLAHIAEIHDQRIEDLENGPPEN